MSVNKGRTIYSIFFVVVVPRASATKFHPPPQNSTLRNHRLLLHNSGNTNIKLHIISRSLWSGRFGSGTCNLYCAFLFRTVCFIVVYLSADSTRIIVRIIVDAFGYIKSPRTRLAVPVKHANSKRSTEKIVLLCRVYGMMMIIYL